MVSLLVAACITVAAAFDAPTTAAELAWPLFVPAAPFTAAVLPLGAVRAAAEPADDPCLLLELAI